MKRTFVLGVIVIAGAVAAAAANLSALQGPPAGQGGQGGQGRGGEQGRGQGRGAPAGGGVSKIEKVAENLYFIFGAGGNTAVYVAADGVVLVDTKNPNNGQAILDQVRSVTPKPITHIINTHTHGDHNGSNIFFPIGVEVVTQENTEANMQKMPAFQEANNKHGLPDRTFKTRFSLLGGDDTIDLYYFGAAHTNGDAFVVFRKARVMHTGDAFANKGQPLIDRNNGGSGIAYPETIAKAATIKNVDTIINGHNMTTMTFQDLRNFADFNRRFLAHARASLKAGKSPEEAMKEFKLPETFKDYNLAGGRGGPGGNFGVIYEELKPGSTKK
jgi:glyoxylase-like metal-dependent hydrolase (beta-lactamase superfamily II)